MAFKRNRPEAMHYSIAELGFVLFFLAAAAAVLIYSRALEHEAQAAELAKQNELIKEEVDRLTAEVDFLNEMLAEKKHGVVPCWRRPDGEIPRLVGTVTIHHRHAITLEHHTAQPVETAERDTPENNPVNNPKNGDQLSRLLEFNFTEDGGPLREAVSEMFQQELAYAREKNCYLRIAVKNETNSFSFYRSVSDILVGMGIVVVSR